MSQAEDAAPSKWDEFLVEGQTIINEVVGGDLLPARTARKIIAFRAEFQDPDLGIFGWTKGASYPSATINLQNDHQKAEDYLDRFLA